MIFVLHLRHLSYVSILLKGFYIVFSETGSDDKLSNACGSILPKLTDAMFNLEHTNNTSKPSSATGSTHTGSTHTGYFHCQKQVRKN